MRGGARAYGALSLLVSANKKPGALSNAGPKFLATWGLSIAARYAAAGVMKLFSLFSALASI